ncbi:hypothetical protein PanWU01x14_070120 [Parasponia andersonii]|uniref:Transmembrane protein n=1 Tax=Parasponia andersonii TaxID=3476 RepID=A0A2P5DEV5_PARAD|nr:hypothetical protein PanWU01x14_070120 [Parasponia andersonii]
MINTKLVMPTHLVDISNIIVLNFKCIIVFYLLKLFKKSIKKFLNLIIKITEHLRRLTVFFIYLFFFSLPKSILVVTGESKVKRKSISLRNKDIFPKTKRKMYSLS